MVGYARGWNGGIMTWLVLLDIDYCVLLISSSNSSSYVNGGRGWNGRIGLLYDTYMYRPK